MMSRLLELLAVRAPLIAVVERDLAWAHASVDDVVERFGARLGTHITWTLTSGWIASESVLRSSGLQASPFGRAGQVDPSYQIGQLKTWLRSSRQNQRDEDRPFHHGLVQLEDLDSYLGEPSVSRMIWDLGEEIRHHSGSVVLLLPRALPPDHLLAQSVAQVVLSGDPEARYGGMVDRMIERFGPRLDGISRKDVLKALGGAPQSLAAVWLDLGALKALPTGSGVGLPSIVEELRAVYESGREGSA